MTNIYLITNLITGQRYVGKTIHSIEYRFKQHATDPQSHTYIDNAIKTYGESNFKLELIATCEDSEWQYWEQYYISKYKSHWTDGGYNLSRGGDANPMEDELVRERHKAAVASEEHRRKQREASLGRRHTDESRKKMSVIQKQVYSDPELRRKVKLNQPTRISVDMLDENDNVLKTFDTLSDACRYFNKSATNSGRLREYVDARNKNGERSKFWGYYWTVSTNKV